MSRLALPTSAPAYHRSWVNERVGLRAGAVVVALLFAGLIGVAGAATDGKLLFGGAVALGYLALVYRSLAAGLALFTSLTFYDLAAAALGDGLTFSKLGGAVLALFWLLMIASRGNRVPLIFRDVPRLAFGVCALMTWALASILWAPDPLLASSDAFRLVQGLILIFVTYTAIRERRHFRWVMAAFVGGALLAALFGILGSAEGGNGRITGGFDDPNELAAVIVPGGVFAAFAFFAYRGQRVRWLFLACLPVFLVALVDTDSQGGLVALAVGVVASVVVGGPLRGKAALFAVLSIGSAIFYYTAVTTPNGLTEGRGSREDLWKVALAVSADHPVAGVGAGNFSVVEPSYALANIPLARADLITRGYVAHNSYLHVLAEFGAVGLALFVGVIVSSLVLALRAVHTFSRARDRQMEILTRGLIAGACSLLAAYFFASAQYEKQLWLVIGVAAGTHALASRIESSGTAAARHRGRPARVN